MRRSFLGTLGIGSLSFSALGGSAKAQQAPGAEILGAEGVKTSELIVHVKAELERMREQVQNVE